MKSGTDINRNLFLSKVDVNFKFLTLTLDILIPIIQTILFCCGEGCRVTKQHIVRICLISQFHNPTSTPTVWGWKSRTLMMVGKVWGSWGFWLMIFLLNSSLPRPSNIWLANPLSSLYIVISLSQFSFTTT